MEKKGFQPHGISFFLHHNQYGVRYIVKAFLIIGTLTLFLILYIYGARLQLHIVNTDKKSTDQSAYMDYARWMAESGYTYIGDHNRMPVYPFLQSLFYRASMTDQDFFQQGKYINLFLSIVLLGSMAIILFKQLPSLSALNLILIIAFTIFIFKAGYFQAELLFYFLNFCFFWLMWQFLQKPTYLTAILGGITAGLAHLTKASILPGLVIFLLFAGIQHATILVTRFRSKPGRSTLLDNKRYLFTIPLFGLIFILTIFPYIHTSKRVFGHYFYNVNSTFYIWYDSWTEAKEGTGAHGDRVGWPDMPVDEIPSMSKYLREHSPQQIMMRFVDGGREVVRSVVYSYGYFKYGLIYSIIFFLAIVIHKRKALSIFTSNRALWLFVAAYFMAYSLLYFWYAPIVSGNRLILAQFLPLLFVLSSGIHQLLGDSTFGFRGKSMSTLTAINLMILLVLCFDIFFVVTERVRNMYGGS